MVVQKKASFLVLFAERMQTIALLSASFFKCWVSKDVVVSELNWKKISRLNVRQVLINEQK